MDVIRGTTDLQYVNRKLLESGFSQTEIGSAAPRQVQVVSPMIEHPVPCNLDIQNLDLPGSSNLISPDSNIPCDSPECPIKGIPHNIGRFYHNGERPKPPEPFGALIRGSAQDVNNTFNLTVPPPEIVTAYLRICMDLHNQADLDSVRQYQKHHMWPLTISEPSTPWPRHLFPEMHGLYGQKTSNGTHEEGGKGELTNRMDAGIGIFQEFDRVGPADQDCPTRPLRASDFEDSDDEYDTPLQPLCDGESGRSCRSLLSPDSTQGDFQEYDADEISPTREIPQGQQLVTERLRLQEKILQQMALHQRLKQVQGEIRGKRDENNKTPENRYNDDDIALEILLELTELLPKALENGGFRSVLLDDRHANSGFSAPELSILSDAQMMLKKALSEIILNATRPYQPTGLPLTATQLHTELASLISRRQYLLAANPGETITEILDKLSREGKSLFDF